MDALKLKLLSVKTESTIRIVLKNRYVAIMLDNNKTYGHYIVKWDRPPHKFQEDTDIFRAGDVVYNATYLNPIKQAHH